MLIDRPNIVEGSSIQNATIASGTTVPSLPSLGELFYNTTLGQLQTYTGSLWDAVPTGALFGAHVADTTLHLTSTQNTLLDGLTLPSLGPADVNALIGLQVYLSGTGATSLQNRLTTIDSTDQTQNSTLVSLQNQINTNQNSANSALTAHEADFTLHLTANENTFLDGLNLPTLTASDINNVPTINVNLNALTSNFNSHVADTTLHLSSAQNTFLDGLSLTTVSYADVNHLNGLDGFLGTGLALATYLSNLNSAKLALAGGTMSGAINMGGKAITNMLDPVNPQDAVTKNYVDQLQQGLSWKNAVKVTTTANITLSGLQTLDGYTTAAGDRVLVKNQTAAAANGIYIANASTWSRSTDADTAIEVDGLAVFVENGTLYKATAWVQTANVVTFPGDSLTFSQFSAAGGAIAGQGIAISSGTISTNNGNGLTYSGQQNTLNVTGRFALGTQLDLATISQSNSGSFLKFTVDTWGRVTGTTAVTAADIGAVAGGNYVSKTGDTMTGNLTIGAGGLTVNGSTPNVTVAGTLGVTGTSTLGAVNAGAITGTGAVFSGDTTSYRSATPTTGYVYLNQAQTRYIGFDGTEYTLGGANLFINGSVAVTAATVNSYAPTLTGVGASGTWGINITGNAATATSATNASNAANATNATNAILATSSVSTRVLAQSDGTTFLTPVDPRSVSGSRSADLSPNAYTNGLFSEFKTAGLYSTAGNYAGLITYANWQGTSGSTGDPSYQLLFSPQGVNSTAAPVLKLRAGIDTTWGAWSTVLHSSNFNAYAPTLTGSGATGTWGISISGNAATATSAAAATLASKASTLAQNGGNGSAMTFNWSGQGGQPTWLWGGNDGINMYVYNPSNFSVNYAASSGTSANATSIAGAVGGAYTWTGQQQFNTLGPVGTNGQMGNLIAATPSGSGLAAGMSFLRNGSYAVNMGLDNDNVFRLGGWSDGTNVYRWTSDTAGNFVARGSMTSAGYTVLTAGNYNNYAPTLTGGGASGTWNINVTGSAGTVSNFPSRTDGTAYPILWAPGGTSAQPTYSCAAVTITSSSGQINCTTLVASGNITAFSDMRLKTDIAPIVGALDMVDKLNGVTYTSIESGKRGTGLIAQDVQAVLPEAIQENGDDQMLSLAYGNLVGLLVEAIKELRAEIKDLRAQLQG